MNTWAYHEDCKFALDLMAAGEWADSQMSESEQQVATSELNRLRLLCQCAQAKPEGIFANSSLCHIKELDSRPHLIELRQPSVDRKHRRSRFQDDRRPRIVRIYYCEPRDHDNVLLALHVAAKPGNAPDSSNEQQAAINDAHLRIEAAIKMLDSQTNEPGGSDDDHE
ncbi:hypothetical protein [Nesterenkonia sp. CF4.4]|uniref:hypothetical protein n=1 Tax=Nesterenkonia sp. CF4.4 TaxID=3373079 RepID=UPI003EE684C9